MPALGESMGWLKYGSATTVEGRSAVFAGGANGVGGNCIGFCPIDPHSGARLAPCAYVDLDVFLQEEARVHDHRWSEEILSAAPDPMAREVGLAVKLLAGGSVTLPKYASIFTPSVSHRDPDGRMFRGSRLARQNLSDGRGEVPELPADTERQLG
jgi:hypothetical protein